MSNSSRKISYFNTLIFTIIAGIVSLLLLAALFFEVLAKWKVFIITVEVGIFLIIGICIWQIIANESLLDKYRKAKNFNIDFTTCPDYYISKMVDDKTICSNEYIVEDEYHNKKLMKVYPADNAAKNEVYPLPNTHVSTFTDSFNPSEKFDSAYIQGANDLNDTQAKCGAVLGQNTTYKPFSKIPWVGVKSRCASFAS